MKHEQNKTSAFNLICMTLLIRDEDVRKAVAPEGIIAAVENVYKQHGLGSVQDTPRREVKIKGKKSAPHFPIKKSTYIHSIGADDPHKVELDVEKFPPAHKVVVDSERGRPAWLGQVVLAIEQHAMGIQFYCSMTRGTTMHPLVPIR